MTPQPPTNVPTKYQLPTPNGCRDIALTRHNRSRSQVKSRSHHDVAHVQPLTNVPTTYQLPTPYSFRDIAQTRLYKLRSLQQGQRSNQGYTMMLHTYNPQPMSLLSIIFLHLTASEI